MFRDHAAGQEGLTVRVKDDSRVVGYEVTADAAGLTGRARCFVMSRSLWPTVVTPPARRHWAGKVSHRDWRPAHHQPEPGTANPCETAKLGAHSGAPPS